MSERRDLPASVADDELAPLPERYVRQTEIREKNRTIRFAIGATASTVSVMAIVWGVVQMLAPPQWWQVVALLAPTLGGPAILLKMLLKTRAMYVDKTHDRVVSLETQLDARRSSSSDPE